MNERIKELAKQAGHTDWVMRITADRRIEVNEDVEVTEAAQKVLDALQNLLKPAQPEQDKLELTLQQQLGKACADYYKAEAVWDKATADWNKARAELERIQNLMEKNT